MSACTARPGAGVSTREVATRCQQLHAAQHARSKPATRWRSETAPLDDGAKRLAEALLLVPASCVWHVHGEFGLHRYVVLQRDVIDLGPSEEGCVSAAAPAGGVVL
jgi:hypothetical protein